MRSIAPSQFINARGVASLLGRTAGWFYAHRAELERDGLPAKDPIMRGWYEPAVKAWLDRRSGVVPASPPSGTAALLAAIRNDRAA